MSWASFGSCRAALTRLVVVAIALALPSELRALCSAGWRALLTAWRGSGGTSRRPGLGALLIAWLTVGVQAWQAARRNPVLSLRAE